MYIVKTTVEEVIDYFKHSGTLYLMVWGWLSYLLSSLMLNYILLQLEKCMFAVFILGENTKYKPKKNKLIFKEIKKILICENADNAGIFCLDIRKIGKPLTHLLKEYDESKS